GGGAAGVAGRQQGSVGGESKGEDGAIPAGERQPDLAALDVPQIDALAAAADGDGPVIGGDGNAAAVAAAQWYHRLLGEGGGVPEVQRGVALAAHQELAGVGIGDGEDGAAVSVQVALP